MRSGLVLVGMLFLSCAIQKGGTLCQHPVKVIDLAGLDGCGLLLEAPNGDRWLPINEPAYTFEVGDALSVSYIREEGMSICMAEKSMVRLTCVQRMNPEHCEPIADIQADGWLGSMVHADHPSRIDRYQWMETYLYEVSIGNASHWYDCHGKTICHLGEECHHDLTQLKGKLNIYTAQR